jgi:hypothetical protein
MWTGAKATLGLADPQNGCPGEGSKPRREHSMGDLDLEDAGAGLQLEWIHLGFAFRRLTGSVPLTANVCQLGASPQSLTDACGRSCSHTPPARPLGRLGCAAAVEAGCRKLQ